MPPSITNGALALSMKESSLLDVLDAFKPRERKKGTRTGALDGGDAMVTRTRAAGREKGGGEGRATVPALIAYGHVLGRRERMVGALAAAKAPL